MTNRSRRKDPLRIPTEGTKIRQLYDLFLTGMDINPWHVVGENNARRYLSCFSDDYGCEFVRNARGTWKMLGRWDGEYFVPVERLCEEEEVF